MVLNKRQITSFLVLTFIFTFSLRGILIIANQFDIFKFGTPFGMLLFELGTISPAIASFVCLRKSGLVSGLKEFAQTSFAIKQKPIHYALVLIFLIAQYIFPSLLLEINSDVAWYMGFLMFIPCIVDGGLEELGWRYLLQPTLEKRVPFFIATSITASIWAIWHLPQFFIEGSGQSTMTFGLFTIMVFGTSFALAAIYHISQSVWLCIMFHSLLNALCFYWPVAQDLTVTLITTVCSITLSVVLVSRYDRKRGNNTEKVLIIR